MGPWQLAIDFGTTNTAAAVLRDGAAFPLRLSSAADQMPSAVLARPDGSLLVGESAANEAAMYLDSFEPNPKYRLGEEAVYLGERDWSPIELVAAVLARVGEKARATTTVPINDAVVLTHPAAWTAHKRDRLRDAALLAGFRDVKLVSEPIAAARWYASRRDDESTDPTVLDRGATIAVFDFGGGTCDVAVLRATDGRAQNFEVLASGGDEFLGGEELDRALMEWTVSQVLGEADDEAARAVEEARGGREWFTFRDAVRRAKHTLSEADSATIPVSLGPTSRTVTISRGQFDEVVAPHLERAMELTRRVLVAANTTPDALALLPGDTAAMYLTGGSATIPVLHERMAELLDRPAARLDDPKTVVPRGALVAPQAAADDAAETLAPPAMPAPSLVQGELAERRHEEAAARPERIEGKPPTRIAELETEISQLRQALQERDLAATGHEPASPARTVLAPTRRSEPARPDSSTRASMSHAPTRPRRGPGIGRILLGLVFLFVAFRLGQVGVQIVRGGESMPFVEGLARYDEEVYVRLGWISLGVAVVALLAGIRSLRGRKGGRR